MSRGIDLSNLAGFDLENIRDHIAGHNPQAADRIIDRIWDAFETLAILPGAGQRLPGFPGVRFFPAGKYVIYYEIRVDTVWVRRIIHCSRDIGRLL